MDRRRHLDAVGGAMTGGKGKASLEEFRTALPLPMDRHRAAQSREESKPAEIDAALQESHRQTDNLEKIVEEMAQRLHPVLRRQDDDHVAGMGVQLDVASPLTNAILENSARVGLAVNRISALLDRIAL